MNRLRVVVCCAFALTFLAEKRECPAADPKIKGGLSLSELSMEIAAMQSLHRLEMTAEQMGAIRKLAAETASKAQKKAGKGSDKVRKRMLDLRDALINGNQARVEELEEQLADLLEEEETELDDRIAVTAAATRKVAELQKLLKISQIASFLYKSADDIPEPADALFGTLDVVKDLDDAEWKDLSKQIVDELKWQLGGLDPERNGAVGDQVADFLKKIRSLGESELKKQRPELEASARELAGKTPPTIVLHNFAEHTLAELLSNPRLIPAIDALVEKIDKDKDKSKDK